MENLPQIVGKNLATLRKARGLTQQELAKEIHYSDKSISKWELGYSLPSVDILKDFAKFYNVSLDYLTEEQTAENLQKAAKMEEGEAKRQRINKLIVIAMTVTIAILICISVFFSEYFTPFTDSIPTAEERVGLWIIFVWMVPSTTLIVAIEAHFFFHIRNLTITLLSVFVWTLLLSFCIQFGYYNDRPEPIWYIMVIGIPTQIILILFGRLKKKT